jgi:hypothetical protein
VKSKQQIIQEIERYENLLLYVSARADNLRRLLGSGETLNNMDLIKALSVTTVQGLGSGSTIALEADLTARIEALMWVLEVGDE